MNLAQTMHEAGIYVSVDPVFQHHLRFGPECKFRARRFYKLQVLVRKRAHKMPGVYAARLVCLDLVSPHDLCLVLPSQPYSIDGQCCVDWKNYLEKSNDLDARVDRRVLSKFSTLSVQGAALNASQEICALVDLLVSLNIFENASKEDVLDELFKDLCSWSTRNLSGPMWAHTTGLRHVWALDRTSLERRVTKRAPVVVVASSDDTELAVAEFLDAARACDTKHLANPDRQILNAAISVFTFRKEEDDTQTLARWLLELLGLKEQIQHGDIATAMVVSWMVDLVESGTIKKANAKPQTRARYIAQLATRLWTALSSHKGSLQDASELALFAMYTAILTDPTCTDRLGLSAAIGSFQAFAEDIWELPSVPLNINEHVVPAIPRVQVVYSHEVDLTVSWLEASTSADPRVAAICATMLPLLYASPFRLNELHWIRLENVTLAVDLKSIEIEICRSHDHSLKNASSIRRLRIDDPLVMDRLLKWTEKRRAEGAVDTDLVFGKKLGAGLYRRALVQVSLRRVLKAATGDDSMTVHALRHAYATRTFADLAARSELNDFNVYTHLAYTMGHASFDMTLRFYVHGFESILRREIDGCLGCDIGYSGDEAQLVSGIKANTLVQHASRHQSGFDAYVDKTIAKQASSMSFAAAMDTTPWVVPVCPVMNLGRREDISLYKVWEIINGWDQAPGLSDAELAQLHDVDVHAVRAVKVQVIALAEVVSSRCAASKSDAAQPILHVGQACRVLDLKPHSILQAKYWLLRRHMTACRMGTELDDLANVYPILVGRPGYIRVDRTLATFPLLRFLKSCGITPLQLLVRIQADPKNPDRNEQLATQIETAFIAIWNSMPEFDVVDSSHPSRPGAYLLWPSTLGQRSPHGVEVKGLECVLLCVCALRAIANAKEISHAH